MKPRIRAEQPMAGRLKPLRDALLALHKMLLEAEREVYEHEVRKVTSPLDMLGLLMNDPWFAWLKEITSLVLAIDEALAGETPVTAEEAAAFLAAARALLRPDEHGQGFAKRYDEALQRDPGMILRHGEMMRLVARLETA
jgi:hypothetical protein